MPDMYAGAAPSLMVAPVIDGAAVTVGTIAL
jgi:hypothetical protein